MATAVGKAWSLTDRGDGRGDMLSTPLPAWYVSANESEWLSMEGLGTADTLSDIDPCPARNCAYSGTEGQSANVDSWCGAVATETSLIIAAQGGHAAYGGNEVTEFDFTSETPQWVRKVEPSVNTPPGVPSNGYNSDGTPIARHGYNHDCYIQPLSGSPNGDRWYAPFCFSAFTGVGGTGSDHSEKGATYRVTDEAYDAADFFPDAPGNVNFDGTCAYDPNSERVWVRTGAILPNANELQSLDVRTKLWTQHASVASGNWGTALVTSFVDPVREVMVSCKGGTSIFVDDLVNPDEPQREYTVSGLPSLLPGCGLKLEPVGGKWVAWNGGKSLYVITPPADYRVGSGSPPDSLNAGASYSASTITAPAGDTPQGVTDNGGNRGQYGRFNYISALQGFCTVSYHDGFMYFYKIPAGGL